MPRGWSAKRRYLLPSRRALFWRTRAPLGAPSRRFLFPGSAFPGTRAFSPNPSPAGSLRSGHSTARSVPEASRARGYEPRPRAPRQPAAVSRCRSAKERCPFSGTTPRVAPSSRRLATMPSAEPGEDGRGFWRKYDYIPSAAQFHSIYLYGSIAIRWRASRASNGTRSRTA
jgi:hypothetical protein